MSHCSNAAARGFTLVEALTGVAVLALLVSITVPAAARTKQSIRQAMCADNLRHLMTGVFSYTNDHQAKGPQRGWKMYTVSEWASEVNGWGGSTKLLCNLGQLYKRYIGGQHDMLYCPATYTALRDAPGTGVPGSGGGWKTAFNPTTTYTFGGYIYGIPLAGKNDPVRGPSKSPVFQTDNPFPESVWSRGMKEWIQIAWVPKHPGKTYADFKVPSYPALVMDWSMGASTTSGAGHLNVLYADGQVKSHPMRYPTSSSSLQSFEIWYSLSVKK